MSGGIVAETIASGKTVATASARVDPRFAGNKSVQTARIEAVVCAPIARAGALYVAGRREPGPFGANEVRIVETCAKGLVPFLSRLAARANEHGAARADATAEVRARMPAPSIVGRSAAIARTLTLAHVAASSDVGVLVLGETGTGKGAVARAIHDASGRAARAFVTIDCASIPEALVESELFGAEKGAHSTATKRIAGKLAVADRGTVFLDEIGELPLESQAKLLSFLQTKRFTPLGAATPIEIDARMIAATNADLEARVRDKTFREDLYLPTRACSRFACRRCGAARRRHAPRGCVRGARAARGSVALTFGARAALASADLPATCASSKRAVERGVAFARAEGTELVDVRHVFPDTQEPRRGRRELPRTNAHVTKRASFARRSTARGARPEQRNRSGSRARVFTSSFARTKSE